MHEFEKQPEMRSEVEDVDSKVDQYGAVELVLPPTLATFSESAYRKLGRKATLKMDLLIIPCIILMYILNYLDRQNIAAAKLADIETDLGLSDVQYQTCISILFVGYSMALLRTTEPQKPDIHF
jgi:hypothetical protein